MARKRGKHTSVRGVFQRSVVWLENLDGIRKVILGPHDPCHNSTAPGTLVVTGDTPTGLRLRGYTDSGIMDIFLILELPSQRDRIRQAIKKRFPLT